MREKPPELIRGTVRCVLGLLAGEIGLLVGKSILAAVCVRYGQAFVRLRMWYPKWYSLIPPDAHKRT